MCNLCSVTAREQQAVAADCMRITSGLAAPLQPPLRKGKKGKHLLKKLPPLCLLPCLQASTTLLAWLVHTLLLKGALSALGIGGAAPFLELAAYAGYAFAPASASLLAALTLGKWLSG